MRTQSLDTHPDVERVQIALIRSFSPEKKFQMVSAHNDQFGFQQSDDQSLTRQIALTYSPEFGRRFLRYRHEHPLLHVEGRNLHATLHAIQDLLTRRGVRFAISGRAACAFYGLPSSFNHLEIACDTDRLFHFGAGWFRYQSHYFDVRHLICVELSHDDRLLEGVTVWNHDQFAFPLTAPEQVILQLLDRFQQGGQRDDSLYNDVLSMVKVQAARLNTAWLQQHAVHPELLARLLYDGGLIV